MKNHEWPTEYKPKDKELPLRDIGLDENFFGYLDENRLPVNQESSDWFNTWKKITKDGAVIHTRKLLNDLSDKVSLVSISESERKKIKTGHDELPMYFEQLGKTMRDNNYHVPWLDENSRTIKNHTDVQIIKLISLKYGLELATANKLNNDVGLLDNNIRADIQEIKRIFNSLDPAIRADLQRLIDDPSYLREKIDALHKLSKINTRAQAA